MTENTEKPEPRLAPPAAEPPAAHPAVTLNPWQMAEEGWAALIAAAEKVQRAANLIKQTEHSVHGYNIERALNKHKPHLLEEHYRGLKDFRQENKL